MISRKFLETSSKILFCDVLNYLNVFNYSSAQQGSITFSRYLLNTGIVAFFSTVGGTIFSILVAFALARLNFKGREVIFTILLATMMIPGEMLIISNSKSQLIVFRGLIN